MGAPGAVRPTGERAAAGAGAGLVRQLVIQPEHLACEVERAGDEDRVAVRGQAKQRGLDPRLIRVKLASSFESEVRVTRDGTTVDAMPGTLDMSFSLGQRAGLTVTVKSDDGSYRPVVGKDIELFEGATKLWAGSVDEVDERSITEAAPTGRYYGIRAVSWEQYLDKRYCYNGSTGRPLAPAGMPRSLLWMTGHQQR